MKQLSNGQFELPVIGTVADTQSAERSALLGAARQVDGHVTLYWSLHYRGFGELTPELMAQLRGGAK